MKTTTTYILLLPFLSSCSLIGAKVGKEVDESRFGDSNNRHKYQAQYMTEGLEEDVETIKVMLSKPAKAHHYADPDPCMEKNTIQVCSLKKGCWCEQKHIRGR